MTKVYATILILMELWNFYSIMKLTFCAVQKLLLIVIFKHGTLAGVSVAGGPFQSSAWGACGDDEN